MRAMRRSEMQGGAVWAWDQEKRWETQPETEKHEGRRVAMGREISRRESALQFQMRKDIQ